MIRRLEGKRAVVTGAGAEIGRAAAIKLPEEGARVAVRTAAQGADRYGQTHVCGTGALPPCSRSLAGLTSTKLLSLPTPSTSTSTRSPCLR